MERSIPEVWLTNNDNQPATGINAARRLIWCRDWKESVMFRAAAGRLPKLSHKALVVAGVFWDIHPRLTKSTGCWLLETRTVEIETGI